MKQSPAWETMINSAAIALFVFGVQEISKHNPLEGGFALAAGSGLELFKYSVRAGQPLWGKK